MNITANCESLIDYEITIRVISDELYTQTTIQLSEYDLLQNLIVPWQDITALTSTNQLFSHTINSNTKFVKVRLISTSCEVPTPTPQPSQCSGVLLEISNPGETATSDGVSFTSLPGNSLCFTASSDLSQMPSTFSIFVSNEEKALVTFWGDYINQPFIFINNNIVYNGLFTSSNRIDF